MARNWDFGNNRGKEKKETKELLNGNKTYMKMIYDLFKAYNAGNSTRNKVDAMMNIIESAGCTVRGRGQNRIGFSVDGNRDVVFKVAFRQIGIEDNKRERYISSCIFNNAQVAKDVGDHFARVYDWSAQMTVGDIDLSDALQDFIIAMENLDNLRLENADGYDELEDAITALAAPENRKQYIDMCNAISGYFWIFDLHPVKSIDNMGVKRDARGNAILAVRDYGYFVPRLGDFKTFKTKLSNGSVVHFEYRPIPLEVKESDPSRYIAGARNTAECYSVLDSSGKMIENRDGYFSIYESDQMYNNIANDIVVFINKEIERERRAKDELSFF